MKIKAIWNNKFVKTEVYILQFYCSDVQEFGIIVDKNGHLHSVKIEDLTIIDKRYVDNV